jgi:uncharacterized protein YunC (DUF1805 family)
VIYNGITEIDSAAGHAKGTPEQPLLDPEDLYEASIVRVSEAARALGIEEGMTGMEALVRMLRD